MCVFVTFSPAEMGEASGFPSKGATARNSFLSFFLEHQSSNFFWGSIEYQTANGFSFFRNTFQVGFEIGFFWREKTRLVLADQMQF